MSSSGSESAFSKRTRAAKKAGTRRLRSSSRTTDNDEAYEESESASHSNASQDRNDVEAPAVHPSSLVFSSVSKKNRTLLDDEAVQIHVVLPHPTLPSIVLLVLCKEGPVTLPLTQACYSSSQGDIRWSTNHPATGLAFSSGAFVVQHDLHSTDHVAISELDALKILKPRNLPAQLLTPIPGSKPISTFSDIVVLRERAFAADFVNDLCVVLCIPCCESLGFVHLLPDGRFVNRSPQMFQLPRGVVPLDVQCCLICNGLPDPSTNQDTAVKPHAIVSTVEHGVFVFSVICSELCARVVPRLTIPPPSLLTSAVLSKVKLFRLANRGIAEPGIPELTTRTFFWTDLCVACASIYWDTLIVMHCASKQVMLVEGMKDISPNTLATCGDTVLVGGPTGGCEEVVVYGLPISGSFAFDRSLAFRSRRCTTLTVSSNILSYRNKSGIRRDIFCFADITGCVTAVQRTASKVGSWKVIGELKLNSKSEPEKYSGWMSAAPAGLILSWADDEDGSCGADQQDATAVIGRLVVLYATGTAAEWHFNVRSFTSRKSCDVKKTS